MKYFKREYWSFKLINIGISLLPKESRNIVFISYSLMVLLGLGFLCILVNLWDLASCREEVTFPMEFWIIVTLAISIMEILQPLFLKGVC